MSSGYTADAIAEHAAQCELAAALSHWQASEQAARDKARWWMAVPGVRAETIAAALGMSRATFYRWIKADSVERPQASRAVGSKPWLAARRAREHR